MHLHLSKSSFSQIFQWSHATHSRPFQSCFQTRFVFKPKAMQSYDHFLNCANFQAFFWKLFSAASSVGASTRGRFPFCGCKGTAICRTDKIFHRKNSNKFSQIFTHRWRPTTYNQNFFTRQNRTKKAMCEPPRDPHIILYRKRIFDKNFCLATIPKQICDSAAKKKEMIYKLSRRRCDEIPLGIWCV